MKPLLSAVCCLALCSVPLLAQATHHPQAEKTGAAAAQMSDQDFVNFAAQTDMVEANLGQEAQNVAKSQAVKDYGQMLVTDHTNDYKKLQQVGQQAGFTVPDAIDEQHNKAMIAPFQKLKDAAFDHRYIREMVAGHTKALDVYKKEANDATNPAIKAYAQDAIPVLQKHLDNAKAIEQGKTPPTM